MTSKMVTDRQKHATALTAALHTHAATASSRFQRLIEPYLREGEQIPDLIFFQELLQRRLAGLRKDLVQVDDQNHRELQEDTKARETRDQSVTELTSLLISLRLTVKGVCGAKRCGEILDLEGPIPRDPVVLQRHAHRVLERLQQGSVESASMALPGVTLDSGPWIEVLEEPLQRLDEALERLSNEQRDTIESLRSKQSLLTDYDRAYGTSARILENFFQHVGLDFLAQRVRPGIRSSGSASSTEGILAAPAPPESESSGAAAPPDPVASPPQPQPLLGELKPERIPEGPDVDAVGAPEEAPPDDP